LACTAVGQLSAQNAPPRLTLADAIEAARAHRAEIAAARARAEAFAQRPQIVSALDDPMIFPSVDHYPFDMMEERGTRRYDWSLSIEQRFPLSGVRRDRERAARAQAVGADADAAVATLDVEFEAHNAFLMVRERRQMAAVLDRQADLAEQLVGAAAARYAAGTGLQADVLRAEVQEARIAAERRALTERVRSAEAMLNVSMGRPASTPLGPIEERIPHPPLPSVEPLREAAMAGRPELRAAAAQIDRAGAEVDVMQSMYRPMAMVRAGRASTMAEGGGAMLMIGISVPMWRTRLRAGVEEARAMQRMAESDLAAMQRMVEGEIAASSAEVQSTLESLHALENDVIPRARTAVDAAFGAYAAGQGTLVLVVDAAQSLWDAERDRVMAQTEVDAAWARLERAVGCDLREVQP
jgi:outer membrane protein TolC